MTEEPKSSTPLIQKLTTAHDSEPLQSTSHSQKLYRAHKPYCYSSFSFSVFQVDAFQAVCRPTHSSSPAPPPLCSDAVFHRLNHLTNVLAAGYTVVKV